MSGDLTEERAEVFEAEVGAFFVDEEDHIVVGRAAFVKEGTSVVGGFSIVATEKGGGVREERKATGKA